MQLLARADQELLFRDADPQAQKRARRAALDLLLALPSDGNTLAQIILREGGPGCQVVYDVGPSTKLRAGKR
jgi:hypothetical protein